VRTQPERRNYTNIDEIATKPERDSDIDEIPTQPGPRPHVPVDEIVTRPGQRRAVHQRFKRILAIILLTLLLFIIALIILAAVFQDINALILRLIHVDMRGEIAYILLLIRQIFS
jgi:hypothetical protein